MSLILHFCLLPSEIISFALMNNALLLNRMIRCFVFGFLLFLSSGVTAQPTYRKYLIELKDKSNAPFSIMQPQTFLTKDALDRRYQSRIGVDSTDLPVTPIYVEQVRLLAHKVLVKSRWLNALGILADSAQIEKIRNLSFVKSVEYLGPYYGSRFPPNVPARARIVHGTLPKAQNGFETVYEGFAAVQLQAPKVSPLRDLFSATGAGIQVAVMDGGFTNVDASPFFGHLDRRGGIVSTVDLVEGDAAVYEASNHGSGVLSVMAAEAPYYFTSPASDANYHLITTEDTGGEFPLEELNWVVGAEYADYVGARVVNASLGYTSFNDTTLSHTYKTLDGRTAIASRGAQIAAKKGMIICNSAGNSGDEPWKYVGVPADTRGIMSVGATTRDGVKATFSSFGPTADGRIKPDLVVPGEMIIAMTNDGQGVQFGSGTSYASPILAASIAALWSGFPELIAQEITDAIFKNASQFEWPDTAVGYGIPDFYQTYLQLLGAYNTKTRSIFTLARLHERNGMHEALLVGKSFRNATPVAIKITDAANCVVLHPVDATHASVRSVEQIMHFARWPKHQSAHGWAKCELIFAEGGNVVSMVLIDK
jgi:serine protease AprX